MLFLCRSVLQGKEAFRAVHYCPRDHSLLLNLGGRRRLFSGLSAAAGSLDSPTVGSILEIRLSLVGWIESRAACYIPSHPWIAIPGLLCGTGHSSPYSGQCSLHRVETIQWKRVKNIVCEASSLKLDQSDNDWRFDRPLLYRIPRTGSFQRTALWQVGSVHDQDFTFLVLLVCACNLWPRICTVVSLSR